MITIVIAASGYIGNVVAERILKEGNSVIGTTRSAESATKLEKQGIQPLIASLEDPTAILDAIPQADAIVYCAYGYNSIEVAQKEVESRTSHLSRILETILLALLKAKPGNLYCTGAESGIKTLSIAESISRSAGLGGTVKSVSLEEAKQIFGHWGEWWSLQNQCSGEKAKSELGWTPRRLSLLEDIEKGSYASSGNSCLA